MRDDGVIRRAPRAAASARRTRGRAALALCAAGLLTAPLGGHLAYAEEPPAVGGVPATAPANPAPAAVGDPAAASPGAAADASPRSDGAGTAAPPASGKATFERPVIAEPDAFVADLAAQLAELAGPLGLSFPAGEAPRRAGKPCPPGAARWAIDRAREDLGRLDRVTDPRARQRIASRARSRLRLAWRCLPPSDPASGRGATGGGERPRPRPDRGPVGDADAPATAPSGSAVTGPRRIPAFLLPIYGTAGARYGIPWEILAAINEIETGYGRNLNVSSAGATGWMQFMPATWRAYGVDADGDGRRDPYDPDDAIFAAARYLQASGAARDLPKAIFAYNHAGWYVASVLLRARAIAGLPPGELADPSARAPAPAAVPAEAPPATGAAPDQGGGSRPPVSAAAAPAVTAPVPDAAILAAELAALLRPAQWMKLIERLARMGDPVVVPRASRYAVPPPPVVNRDDPPAAGRGDGRARPRVERESPQK